MELVRHYIHTTGRVPESTLVDLGKAESKLTTEVFLAGIEWFSHLFRMLRDGTYDIAYDPVLLVLLLIDGHEPRCFSDRNYTDCTTFCRGKLEDRHVVFIEGLKEFDGAVVPERSDHEWWDHIPEPIQGSDSFQPAFSI